MCTLIAAVSCCNDTFEEHTSRVEVALELIPTEANHNHSGKRWSGQRKGLSLSPEDNSVKMLFEEWNASLSERDK